MRAISGFYIENGYDPSYLKWITLAAGQRIDNAGVQVDKSKGGSCEISYEDTETSR